MNANAFCCLFCLRHSIESLICYLKTLDHKAFCCLNHQNMDNSNKRHKNKQDIYFAYVFYQ